MMQETEPRRFRIGESANRPIGGHVADTAFVRALREVAFAKGFESQYSLSRALGKKGNKPVGSWYRDENVPTPNEFGKLLILLEPTDEELEMLVEPYAQLLIEGRGIRGRSTKRESVINKSMARMKPGSTVFGQWVVDICREKEITLKELSQILGLGLSTINNQKGRLGLNALSHIVQNAPSALGLSKEQTEVLGNAVAQTIQQRLREGHMFKKTGSVVGFSVIKMQKESTCPTYNSSQAAKLLGVSRECVRIKRKQFDLPYLLTDEHIEMLRQDLKKSEVLRNRQQQTRVRNHLRQASLSV